MPVTRGQVERFRDAVAEGDVDYVRRMLAVGFDINHTYEVNISGLLTKVSKTMNSRFELLSKTTCHVFLSLQCNQVVGVLMSCFRPTVRGNGVRQL